MSKRLFQIMDNFAGGIAGGVVAGFIIGILSEGQPISFALFVGFLMAIPTFAVLSLYEFFTKDKI